MTEVRQVYNNTWTVAGWKSKWYVIEGTPPISTWAGPRTLTSLSGWAPFRNRSRAMRFIRQIETIKQLQADMEETSLGRPLPPGL